MPALGRVKSWTVLGVAALLAGTCGFCFHTITQKMNAAAADNGFKGPVSELEPPDLRMGYTSSQLEQLFTRWGHKGCMLYVLCEVLDVFMYFPGYGGILLVLMNRLGALAARKTGIAALRQSYTWVVGVVAVDAVENVLHLLLVLSHMSSKQQQLPTWWHTVAAVASIVLQIKWWIARFGLCYSPLLAAAALSPSLKKKKT